MKTPSRSEPIKAAYWMIGAMVSFTLMAIAGRSLAKDLDTFEIMMYRSFIGIFIVLFFGHFFKTLGEINLDKIRLHFIRNLMHFIGQNLWFLQLEGRILTCYLRWLHEQEKDVTCTRCSFQTRRQT